MSNKFQSLLPLILVSLGFIMIRIVINMPLLDWHVSEITTDFPPDYEVKSVASSPWTASPGEALDDGSFILQKIRVISDGSYCRKETLKFIVNRSQHDEIVEEILNAGQKNTSLLMAWSTLGLILPGIYILWFITGYKRFSQAFNVIIIAGLIYIFLLFSTRIVGPQTGYGGPADCSGTITFSAKLVQIHYETLIVLFLIILAELGAFGMMLRQISKAITKGNKVAS